MRANTHLFMNTLSTAVRLTTMRSASNSEGKLSVINTGRYLKKQFMACMPAAEIMARAHTVVYGLERHYYTAALQ